LGHEPADVLDRLEQAIGRLSDPAAPLDELVSAHQTALKLLDEAEKGLQALRTRIEDLGRQLQAP
jgi:exodeoxyribonuclease VII small subunit